MSQVMIITGSAEDELKMLTQVERLLQAEVSVYAQILPVDCTPEELKERIEDSTADAFMVGSSQAPTLSGIVAGMTDKPVISIPLGVDPAEDHIDLLSNKDLPTDMPYASTFVDDVGTGISITLDLLKK